MFRFVRCTLLAVAAANVAAEQPLQNFDDNLNMLQKEVRTHCLGYDCDTGGNAVRKKALLQTEGELWPFTSGASDGSDAKENKAASKKTNVHKGSKHQKGKHQLHRVLLQKKVNTTGADESCKVCHKQSTALVQALQGEVEKLSRRLEATTAPGESSDSARDNPQGRWTDGKSSFDLPEHICDFERFNGPEWFKKQGCSGETCSGKMPTKPTVFTGMMDDWGGMQMNWTYEMMADMYGSVHIELFDEWEQAGGVLGYAVAGKSGGSAFQVRDVVRKFRDEHFMGEHEDFYCGAVDSKTNKDRNGSPPHGRVSVDCKMSLCCQMKGAGIIKVPKWLEGDSFPTGESFSFSPSGGGFAMHAHSAAWLGLVHGEKAWFVEDPTKIDPSRPYYDKVLPQILNARGFAKQVMQLPVAKRPWFCVQRKGDLLYLPDAWWHATLNRGDFSLAFGTKPTWFNTEFKKAGSVDARYNKGDVIASETVKKQSTALALKIEKATTVKDLSQLATLVIDATRQELSRERVSPNDRDRSRAGGNAVAAAATLCIAAKGLERRNIVRINTAPWQVKNEDEALLLDWLRNAKAYNKDSSACKEVLGAERWDKLTPAPV